MIWVMGSTISIYMDANVEMNARDSELRQS